MGLFLLPVPGCPGLSVSLAPGAGSPRQYHLSVRLLRKEARIPPEGAPLTPTPVGQYGRSFQQHRGFHLPRPQSLSAGHAAWPWGTCTFLLKECSPGRKWALADPGIL